MTIRTPAKVLEVVERHRHLDTRTILSQLHRAGYMVVPVNATEIMARAAEDAEITDDNGSLAYFSDIWDAMVEAFADGEGTMDAGGTK